MGISMSTKARERYCGGTNSSRFTREEEVEHPLVEHLPRADLLLDHVEARALDVQLRVHCRSKIWRVARREGGCNYPTIRLA